MTTRAEFSSARKDGRAKAGRFVVLSTLASDELPFLKVGFITTRRVGKAHDRNRLRRRFRSIVQRHAEAIENLQRYLVTIPRPGASEASFEELEKDWLKQARRLGLIRQSGQELAVPNGNDPSHRG